MSSIPLVSLRPHLFDGKVCSGCGRWLPFSEYHARRLSGDGLQPICKSCRLVENRKYVAANREKVRAYMREWRNNNLDKARAYAAKSYRKDPKRHREWVKRWAAKNPDKKPQWAKNHPEQAKAISRDWYQRNRDRARANSRAWYQNNPAKVTAKNSKRRANILSAGQHYTSQEWIDLCVHYEKKCLRCGAAGSLTADHIVPLSRGGSNSISNIQPLCLGCNNRKFTKVIDYRPGV